MSLTDLSTLERRAEDLQATVTAAGLEDVVPYAPIIAGPMAALYAATRPERTRALILVNSFAALSRSEEDEAGVTPAERGQWVGEIERDRGSERFLRAPVPSVPFVTGTRAAADRTRTLATLLFTDVVGSTDRLATIGDRAWCAILDRLDDAVNRQIERFFGHQEKHTGDGILATFDGPARAIRCGTAIRDAARQIGLDVRVGIHTGEIERRRTDLAGIAVHLAWRVCEAAQPGEVLVSRTVVDLVAGSGTIFDDRGEHELKGIPGPWRLFAVTA